tara:strand:- start:1329 stop:1826 length:498 start_codon:yes stop_codon:yes gene_type:complete
MGKLTLSITENINITYGGFQYNYTTVGGSDDLEINNVDAYTAQTLLIPHTSFTQVAKFGSTLGMGLYKTSDFKYMRFRNTDSSNFVTLQLSDATTNKQVNYKILAGEAMYFTSLVFDCNSSTTSAAADVVQGTANVTGLAATADEVQLKADSAGCNVDILIAYDL